MCVSITHPPIDATLQCPTKVVTAKLANKYIQILFNIRKMLGEGVPALNTGYENDVIIIITNEFYDSDDDNLTND